jgi:phage FluMu gp28-like protein
MILEDFQQEYECNWVDVQASYFTWEELAKAQRHSQSGGHRFWRAKTPGEVQKVLRGVASLIKLRKGEGIIYAGMDIGRRRDLTEILLLMLDGRKNLWVRGIISLTQIPFQEQFNVVQQVFDSLPVAKFMIDQTGIGMQLAEDLVRRYPNKAEGVMFTAPIKESMAVGVKIRLQKETLLLPADRDLSAQVHSIRRIVGPSGRLLLDVDRAEKSHADQFWAMALGVLAADLPRGVFLG